MTAYEFSTAEIDAATDAALECLAWTTPAYPEDGDDYRGYLQDFPELEFSDAARATVRKNIASFLETDNVIRLFHLLERYGVTFTPEQIGHDFILTANGHGTGFWDRDYRTRPKAALDALSDIVRPFGEFDAYVGDAGGIEVSA